MFKANLPNWERLIRGAIGVCLLVYASISDTTGVWLYAIVGIAVTALATAVLRYCPVCAVAGRKL
ncbi:YgaP family membrane protein [Sphingorhabdus contaminans]|uniref:YgaP family membrane protein n=1 Tax=Sphingorhabdus contaminans TaxID=1343899 RepID=UPI003D29E695